MKLTKTLPGQHLQIEIRDNCEFDEFYKIADLIQKNLNIIFIDKIDDFDSLYWSFKFDDQLYSLDYNVFLGIDVNIIASNLQASEEVTILSAMSEKLQKFIL